jgi:hypothetical protein
MNCDLFPKKIQSFSKFAIVKQGVVVTKASALVASSTAI